MSCEESCEDLKTFALLAEFTDEDREALFELLEDKKLAKGRRLFVEGGEAEGLVLVRSGTVRLSSKRSGDLGVVGAGVVLGALSLIALGPRESTAKIEENCDLWELPRTAYRRLVEDAPRTACKLSEAILLDLVSLVRPGLDRLVVGGELC